jgi:hypothetical protein
MSQADLEKEAIKLLSEWKPLPQRLTKALPIASLKALLKVAQRLRAHGYANRRYRVPERLRAMDLILRKLAGEPPDPTEEDQGAEARAAESLGMRVTDALRQAEMRSQIALARM